MENPWRMLSPKEAGKQLGVSDQAVRRYWRSGILKGHKHGKFLLIDQRAVLALIQVLMQARGQSKPPPVRKKAAPAEDPANANPAEGIVLTLPGGEEVAV